MVTKNADAVNTYAEDHATLIVAYRLKGRWEQVRLNRHDAQQLADQLYLLLGSTP